jgi:hypothetical protein
MESDGRQKRPKAKKANRVQKPENRTSWQPFTGVNVTEEDALKIAVYVLHHSDEDKLRAGEIISRARNPSLRALWSGQIH